LFLGTAFCAIEKKREENKIKTTMASLNKILSLLKIACELAED